MSSTVRGAALRWTASVHHVADADLERGQSDLLPTADRVDELLHAVRRLLLAWVRELDERWSPRLPAKIFCSLSTKIVPSLPKIQI